jgi:hypothetical protein
MGGVVETVDEQDDSSCAVQSGFRNDFRELPEGSSLFEFSE